MAILYRKTSCLEELLWLVEVCVFLCVIIHVERTSYSYSQRRLTSVEESYSYSTQKLLCSHEICEAICVCSAWCCKNKRIGHTSSSIYFLTLMSRDSGQKLIYGCFSSWECLLHAFFSQRKRVLSQSHFPTLWYFSGYVHTFPRLWVYTKTVLWYCQKLVDNA